MFENLIGLSARLFFSITGIQPYMAPRILLNHKRSIYDFIRFRKWPMFRRVLIETSSFCNRRCLTCPVANRGGGVREKWDI